MSDMLLRLMAIGLMLFGSSCAAVPVADAPTAPGAVEYVLVAGPERPESRFEPSGAAYDPASDRLVVFNDKDDEPPVYVFGFGKDGGLVLDANTEPKETDGRPTGAMKFEDAAASSFESGAFYALTACDRDDPGYCMLLRFRLKPDGLPVFEREDWFPDFIGRVKQDTGLPYLKVEALAVVPSDGSLLVGVREVGMDYESPRRVVMIWRVPPGEPAKARKVMEFETAQRLGREEGISGLEYDAAAGRYLMLTSYEGGSDGKADIGGHLWEINAAFMDGCVESDPSGAARVIAGFEHKPEAVTVNGAGDVVVFFDDDAKRKEPDAGKAEASGRFNMSQNQAAMAVMRAR